MRLNKINRLEDEDTVVTSPLTPIRVIFINPSKAMTLACEPKDASLQAVSGNV
jgi:hypothetical protein